MSWSVYLAFLLMFYVFVSRVAKHQLLVVICFVCIIRVMKAAAEDNVNNSETSVGLTSGLSSYGDNSSDALQTVPDVSITSDSVDDAVPEQHGEGMVEPSILSTVSEVRDVSLLLEADSEENSPSAENCCSARPVESFSKDFRVDKLVEDGLDAETAMVDYHIPVDVEETKGAELFTEATDVVQCSSQPSSCNELSSSLTDTLDICEQSATDNPDAGAECNETANVISSVVPASNCLLTLCQCSSDNMPSEVIADDRMVVSPTKPELEDVENGQCQSDSDLTQSETAQPLSESFQPVNSLDHSDVVCEEDLAVSNYTESSEEGGSDAADIVVVPSSDDDNLQTSLASSVFHIAPGVQMETEPEIIEDVSPTVDSMSLAVESDCEPGGKASKLDQPLSSDEFETSDTGALHMSVGFQPTLHDDKDATFDGSSDMSRDTSIDVLMVCDDDGLVNSVSAEPPASTDVSSEDGVVVLPGDGDYESLVVDSSASFTEQLSTEAPDEKRFSVGDNGSESSDEVTSKDLMLCEVDSKSREMEELLADISQSAADASHEAQLSDASIYLHEDSEFC